MKRLGILFFAAIFFLSPTLGKEASTSALSERVLDPFSGVAEAPHTLKDNAGTKPQRIVSLSLGTDEILLSLVDPKRIVAITTFASDPGISNVPGLAEAVEIQFSQIGVEAIVALKPDLVLAAPYSAPEAMKQLKALGLPVVTMGDFSTIEAIQKNIRLVGVGVGETEAAAALISAMDARLHRVAERLSGITRRPGLLSFGAERWTSGKDTIFDEMVTLAGGRNLAAEAGITGHPKLSLEAVVALDPEVLILNAWHPKDGEPNPALLSHPALQSLSAIKTHRVYAIPGKYLTTVSHFIVEGVEEMARRIHPTLFAASPSTP